MAVLRLEAPLCLELGDGRWKGGRGQLAAGATFTLGWWEVGSDGGRTKMPLPD